MWKVEELFVYGGLWVNVIFWNSIKLLMMMMYVYSLSYEERKDSNEYVYIQILNLHKFIIF